MKLKCTSQEIDRIPTNTMVLTFFQDERPLKGATGLTDWRMCGRLSRLIMEKWIDGHFGEPLLMPSNHRLQSELVLMVGLGPRAEYDLSRFKQVIEKIFDALKGLHAYNFTLSLPGIALTGLDAVDAAEMMGKVIQSRFGTNKEIINALEVTVVAPGPDLKRINPIFARLERSIVG